MTHRAEHVLVLTLVFPPESVSTAQLFGELVEDLVRQGRRVTVITTKPHYHPASARDDRKSLRARWGPLLAVTTFRGATVYHTAMPVKAPGLLRRSAGWLGFHVLGVLAAGLLVRRVDAVLAPSPPITIGVAAWLTARLKGARYVYNVQELYPDTAVALGALRPGFVLRLAYAIERFVYDRARAVTVIGDGMRQRIVDKGVPPERLHLIPNFVDTTDLVERSRDNAFAREFGLGGRFVVMYAGNMGHAQGLEVVLEAAHATRERTDIVYALVGEGVSRASLIERARRLQLANVVFIPQQPYARVPDIYGASDVNIVPLVGPLVDHAVPSKVYRIMAACRPVIAIADRRSDLARVVCDAGAGWVVPPADATALASTVMEAADAAANGSRLATMARNGRDYVLTHVERSHVTARYGALLDEVAGG